MKNIFKSKSKITIILISISTTIFGLALPIITHASIWGDVGKDILSTIGDAIQYLFSWLLKAGASFFEGMLGIGFKSSIEIITTGWTVCRDIANMLFILFMVVIAFATIFRIEEYGIKKLLPKVIGIALLINFSMVFCSAIIDFSNIFADFFIKDITKNLSQTNKSQGVISATFADAFNVTGTYVTFTNCEDFKKLGDAECSRFSSFWDPTSLAICKQAFQNKFEECKTTGRTTTLIDEKSDASFLNLFLEYTVGSIVLLMAAFVLFAGGIMILFRIIVICFLMIISPLVFMCYILPSLRTNWSKWWKTFLNWCIFAPAYAFFVWIAIQIAVSGANKRMGLEANQYTISGNYNPMANSFISAPGQQLISYLVILGFLIGGLIVAKQLGIYGAEAVIKIAKGAQKGATNWAKRTALKPSKYAGAGALRMGAKLFGGENTKLGRRMGAKAAQVKQSTAQSKENKAYANLLKTMNDKDLLREVETAGGVRKLIATQEAKRRGLLREAERPVVQKSMQAMRSYGDEEGARSLEELRPDAIENDPARKEAIERAIKEGTHKKWSKKVLQSPEGIRVLGELKRQLGIGEFAKVFKGWAKEIQETAEDAMKSEFTSDFTNMDNISKRKDYAKVTGKVQEAFLSDNMGVIQSSYFASSKRSIQNYIQGLGDEDFGNLRTNSDKALAARYIKPSQVQGAGAKLTGKDKERMKIIAQGFNPAAYDEMIKPKSNWTT